MHNLCRWNSHTRHKHQTHTHASLLFPARLRFHLPFTLSVSFRSFFIRFILIIVRIYVPRIVYSHTVPVLFHSFCSHTLGLLSFRIRWKGRMRVSECLSVYTRIHATWYWISRIYLFLHSFFSSHSICRHSYISLLNDSVRLDFMCFAFCCFWLYNCLVLLFSCFFYDNDFCFYRCSLYGVRCWVVMMMHANLFVDFLVGILDDFRYGWCTIDCAWRKGVTKIIENKKKIFIYLSSISVITHYHWFKWKFKSSCR